MYDQLQIGINIYKILSSNYCIPINLVTLQLNDLELCYIQPYGISIFNTQQKSTKIIVVPIFQQPGLIYISLQELQEMEKTNLMNELNSYSFISLFFEKIKMKEKLNKIDCFTPNRFKYASYQNYEEVKSQLQQVQANRITAMKNYNFFFIYYDDNNLYSSDSDSFELVANMESDAESGSRQHKKKMSKYSRIGQFTTTDPEQL